MGHTLKFWLILEIKIKTRNANLIDSCCFIAMPLSRFSDTFNIPHTKGHSLICLMFLIIIIMLDHCLLCSTMIPMGWKNRYVPNWLNGIRPTKMTCLILQKRFMSTAKQMFSYSSQVALSLETLFITDTGKDPFQSCTIAGACMNVIRTSHLKPNSIGRVPVNGYRSHRNYSNKSMEWITYCEKITGVSYRHAWSVGGEMYLKKAKACADAYY